VFNKKFRNTPLTLLPGVRRSARLAFGAGLLLGLLPLMILCAYGAWGPQREAVHALVQQITQPSLNTTQDDLDRLKNTQKLDQEENHKLHAMIESLEAENAKLKDELSIFEGFVPNGEQGALSLKNLQITPDAVPNQFRYRALMIQGELQPRRSLKIQLLIQFLNQGKPVIMVLPSNENTRESQFSVDLTRFAKVAGVFSIPSESTLQSVEVRVLDGKTIRATSMSKF
jgi:septal ring factor EnvC (AmiA/AmiB activator)